MGAVQSLSTVTVDPNFRRAVQYCQLGSSHIPLLSIGKPEVCWWKVPPSEGDPLDTNRFQWKITFSFRERLLMLFGGEGGVESCSNHMESIGSRRYPYSLLGGSLEIPRGRGGGSPRPTFLMYSLYGLKMNISRGALVGNTDTLEQLRHCKKWSFKNANIRILILTACYYTFPI